MIQCTDLLLSFSAAAEAVLDHCIETDDGTKVYANFQYHFLENDGYSDEPLKESLIQCSPKLSAEDHPLALMVSLLECITLI